MALLGTAFLFRGISKNEKVQDVNVNIDLDIKSIDNSICWYEKAFSLARSLDAAVALKPFVINYSSALFHVGKYSEALKEVERGIVLGINEEELLRNKAIIEAASGDYETALRTYDKIPGFNSSFNKTLILILKGHYDKGINKLKELIFTNSLTEDELIFCKELLSEAFIGNGQLSDALSILNELHKEGKSTWRAKITWGKYFEKSGELEKGEKYFEDAIDDSNNHQLALFEAIEFFGRNSKFSKAIKLLRGIIEKDTPFKVIFKRYVYQQLVKAFYLGGDYYEVIEYSLKGIQEGVPHQTFRDIISEAYMNLKKYSDAKKILNEIYNESPNNYQNLIRLALSLVLMGCLEESVGYFEQAERSPKSNNDSNFFVYYSKVKLLLGDKQTALEYARRAKDIDINNPKSNAHSFYIHMGLRCGATDQTIKYMVDFHSTYPREGFIKLIKVLDEEKEGQKKLTAEFTEILTNLEKRFKFLTGTYKSQPMVLSFLANSFNSGLNEIWHWRNIYKLPIYIDSGRPDFLGEEIKNVMATETIMLDYLALLILNHLGFLDIFLQDIEQIYIPQSLFEEIQNSILKVEDQEVISLWNTIRKNPKITFCTVENNSEPLDKELLTSLGKSSYDCINISKKNLYTFCAGDERLKRFAQTQGLKVTGIYSILIRLINNKKIDSKSLAQAKVKLIQENHTFISFNQGDILALGEVNNYQLSQEIETFFDVILKTNPDVRSFINAYTLAIFELLRRNIKAEIIQPWINKYIQVFQTLYLRDYGKEVFPALLGEPIEQEVDSHTYRIRELCLMALFDLIVIIEVETVNDVDKSLLYSSFHSQINHFQLVMDFYSFILPEAKALAKSIKKKKRAEESRIRSAAQDSSSLRSSE